MTENENSSTNSMVGPMLIGGIVGAAIALLLAPATGEETRERVASWFDEGRRKTQEYLAEKREVLNKKTGQLGSALEAGKKAYQEKDEEKTVQYKPHDKFAKIN